MRMWRDWARAGTKAERDSVSAVGTESLIYEDL